MAEPFPTPQTPEAAKPQSIIVGETAIYLTTPQQITGKEISYITILGADKRANNGVESAVPLVKEASRKKGEEGKLIDKPLTNVNAFDEIPWDKLSGVQWTDETGTPHIITKEALSLEPKAAAAPAPETPEASSTPIMGTETPAETPVVTPEPAVEQPSPVATQAETPAPTPTKDAREILETLKEDPNTITIVGLKAYETRALDLADRSMQKLSSPSAEARAAANRTLWEKTKDAVHGIHEFVFTNVWKQSIGGIYFHEKSRQYYMDMLKTAETPFAEEAIRMAERRATDRYNAKLADANFLVRAGTKAADWFKDKVGMRTSIQTMALEEIGAMRLTGEIKGLETFEREAKAVRARFGTDLENADQFIRSQLGEKLEILDPTKEEHKPLVEGIQSLLKQYASGEIADKTEFDNRTKEFFEATLKDTRPDIFAEAELYSSSLYEVAETLRTKMSHEAGLANIDEAIAGMQIRLGLGQMGEVTSLEPTAVEKGVGQIREIAEWLNKKNVLVPLLFNEATIGSGVALALSAVNFLKTAPFKAVAGITGPLGSLTGGALAGGLFAGWREYGQLNRDYMTHLRERETGAQFTETQKRRAWFEKFAVKQRRADEMIANLSTTLYENDALKTNLTDDELRSAFATVADLHARKAVSETGPKRIGMIQFSNRETIESERAALDLTANKALADLDTYLSTHAEQSLTVLGGNTFPEFMEKLTVSQTQVLREGVSTLDALDDPIKLTLNLVSSYAPEVDIVKRRWPFASKALSGEEKAMGLDAILEEFKAEARVEAVKYGVKAGVVGAAVGAAVQGIAQIGHGDTITRGAAELSDKAHATGTAHIELSPPSADHVVSLGPDATHQVPYQLPRELTLTPHTDNAGNVLYDAKLDQSLIANLRGQEDVVLGTNMTEDEVRKTLEKAGLTFVEPHKAGDIITDTRISGTGSAEIVSSTQENVIIPGLVDPSGKPIEAALPADFSMKQVGDHWQILDADKHVITNIKLTDTGEFAGDDAAFNELQKDLLAKGYKMYDDTVVRTVEAPSPFIFTRTEPTAEAVVDRVSGTIDLNKELGGGGLWDHFMTKAEGDHPIATTNAIKNMFRLYEQYEVPHTADGLPTNITFDNADHVAHLRDATFGDTAVKEFDIAKISPDAHINVPKELFSDEAIARFSNLNDRAIDNYEVLIARGMSPMDALQSLENGDQSDKVDALMLRLGYFGRDADLPTKTEMALLFKEMGASATPEPTTPTAPEIIQQTNTYEIHKFSLSRVYTEDAPMGQILATRPLDIPYNIETTVTPGTPAPELPWVPIFIPYRHVLEAMPVERLGPNVLSGDMLLSPFGYEETFINRETLAARKSPRLTENPQAKLNEREEIDWYLSSLSPEETQILEDLKSQENPAVHPDVRAVVTIPLVQNGNTIYDRLTHYAAQTNVDGTPLDPKRTEFVIYEATVTPPAESVNQTLPGNTKAEIERFKAEHPDMQIVYVTRDYQDAPTSGQVKRDMTNFTLSRLASRPAEAPEVAVIAENSTGRPVEATYLSSIIDALDTNPTLDMVSGTYQLPQETYATYPMLFAHHRAFEVFDALVRHGEAQSVPAVFQGNLAVRAGTLAAVGGYNQTSPFLEERELAWMITEARGTPDVATVLPTLTATMDPKETIYMQLQQLGLAEPAATLENNEVYKNMTWEDMGKIASEQFTKEHLETHLTNMYDHMYPSLKNGHPERFDGYFSRALDSLGLTYEIKDGKVNILDMTNLNANMSVSPDIEAYAKNTAPEIVAATPKAPETSREHLESMAGEAPETTPPTETSSNTETVASSISSPEVSEVQQSEQSTATEAPKPEAPLPEGVEDRINYIVGRSKESEAKVQFTGNELMDYVKSSVDMAGTRITGGRISLLGNRVKLEDMTAKIKVAGAKLGEAQFSGTLITDPAKGLVVDKNTLNIKLPMLFRIAEGTIRNSLNNFNGLVLDHINSRVNQQWQAGRIDVAGDKLEISFVKKQPK
jgi:hypothetical protein